MRFLWVSDILKDNPEIIIKRFTAPLFGLNSSPFLLNMTIWTHMMKFSATDEEIVTKFLRDLYMDDNISGAQTLKDAFESYFKSRELMRQG